MFIFITLIKTTGLGNGYFKLIYSTFDYLIEPKIAKELSLVSFVISKFGLWGHVHVTNVQPKAT